MPTPDPFAVIENHRILACDRKAALRGVQTGMTISTALALAPRLKLKPRDAAAETEAVLGLAAWSLQFTPEVMLELPDGLALEVAASLKLLGGLETVLTALRAGLHEMGYMALLACAPTLRAACWMTRAGPDVASPCLERESLERCVAALPLSVLSEPLRQGLRSIGAACVGDVLALPRDGLARRFGQPLLDDIDRALGRLPEVRTRFQPPAKFQAAIELPAEVTQSEALLFASRRLLLQLGGFLAARCAGVQDIMLRLEHRDGVTNLAIHLLAPSRDADRFMLLLREQLGRLELREPVRALSISADEGLPLAGDNLALFTGDAVAGGRSWTQLIERLRARLGDEAVQHPELPPAHRPEDPGNTLVPQLRLQSGERPFWLLPSPQPLMEVASAPQYHGPLELLAGPERIESGWWEGEEALRDYFIARSPQRAMLWIYRERHPGRLGQWFLHGIFA